MNYGRAIIATSNLILLFLFIVTGLWKGLASPLYIRASERQEKDIRKRISTLATLEGRQLHSMNCVIQVPPQPLHVGGV